MRHSPKFSSGSSVYSEEKGISVKAGEREPFQIVSYILGRGKTYIHLPYGNTLNLYMFKGDMRFDEWKRGSETLREEIQSEVREGEKAEEEEWQLKRVIERQLKNI